MSNELVSAIWHFKVEDKLDWGFCCGILKQDHNIEITPTELKKEFCNYLKQSVGIAPYTKCPLCGDWLLPRKSNWGYFIGCTSFPKCNFIASDTKPYIKPKT
jgi:hypothetical protein